MRPYKLLGELPKGNWQFHLLAIRDEAGVIVVADVSGQNAPRMIIGDKLVTVS